MWSARRYPESMKIAKIIDWPTPHSTSQPTTLNPTVWSNVLMMLLSILSQNTAAKILRRGSSTFLLYYGRIGCLLVGRLVILLLNCWMVGTVCYMWSFRCHHRVQWTGKELNHGRICLWRGWNSWTNKWFQKLVLLKSWKDLEEGTKAISVRPNISSWTSQSWRPSPRSWNSDGDHPNSE